MDFTHALTLALLPEMMLAGAALISLLVALIRPGLRADIHRWIACIGLAGSLAVGARITVIGTEVLDEPVHHAGQLGGLGRGAALVALRQGAPDGCHPTRPEVAADAD